MPVAAPINQAQIRWTNIGVTIELPMLTALFSVFEPTFTGDCNLSVNLLTATYGTYTPIINTGVGAGQYLPILGIGS